MKIKLEDEPARFHFCSRCVQSADIYDISMKPQEEGAMDFYDFEKCRMFLWVYLDVSR